MYLSELCIKRPIFACMMSLLLILFGVVALLRLPVRELPDIDAPIVTVTTIYPGAAAAIVETEVTEPLEDSINSIPGIKKISSQSNEQGSTITIEFNLAREIELAAQDVRDRVARVRSLLPENIKEPVIAKQDADARPVLWIALFSENYSTLELTSLAEKSIKDRLQTVPGVSSVIFGGEKRFAIRLWLNSEKMAARGITILDLEQALKAQNVELPSGRIEGMEREFSIQTKGELKTPEEFNKLVLKQVDNKVVQLKDVGFAQIGVEDERSVARYNSKPAVGLGIVRQSKSNIIEVANGIKAELKRLEPSFPASVKAIVAYDESIFVQKAINEVWESLFISFILVVLIIYFFLRDARATLIPSLSIPICVVGTFAVLYAIGYSINIISMLALVLSIGIVVDDSIVVLENIYRYIEEGEDPLTATVKAMREIGFAIITITLALVAMFIPLAFQTSLTGRLFKEFAYTLSAAVVISAFTALTITPAIAGILLQPHNKNEQRKNNQHNSLLNFFERILNRINLRYERSLFWSVNNKAKVILGAIFSLLLTLFFLNSLQSEFLPDEDKARLFCISIAPEGSTPEYTNRMIKKMEGIIAEVPDVLGYFSAVALPMSGPGQGNQGLMFIRFNDDKKQAVKDIVGGPKGLGARFFGEVQGAFAIPIMPKAIESGFSQPLQLVLKNPDLEKLSDAASTLVQKLNSSGFLMSVRSTFELNKPELEVEIDRNKAASLGVSIFDISRTLQILFGGLDLSKIKVSGKEYDVIAQLERDARLNPQDLNKIYVKSSAGELIQLASLIKYKETAAPNSINRFNRSRSTTIEGTPMGIPLGAAVTRVEEIIKQDLPSDIEYQWTGEADSLNDAKSDSIFVFTLAAIVIYMVLASQFESLIHPLTIMIALPLAGVGALGLIWLLSLINGLGISLYGWTHYAPTHPWFADILSSLIPRIPAMTINLFSIVGFILLLGLVTKNSILLVEFANQRVNTGLDATTAMLEAGKIRLRPILMTAFSTIIGIVPIAIGLGAGAESRRPLGVAVIGGMLSSTFLTLYVVPVIYIIFSKLKRKKDHG